jgi:uncharacterized protein RhaS with RHS repeats
MRDYDPTTGRYLEADPLGLVDGASVYGYVRQSPLMFADPRGECAGPLAIACAAAAGAVVNVAIGAILDAYLGDGCYTWEEIGRDAALGALFGGLGRAWGAAGAAARYADDAARAAGKAGAASGASQAAKRPSWVPDNWISKPSRKGGGTRYTNPENPHDFARVMPGNAASPNPSQRGPYVIKSKNGQTVDVNGNPVPSNSPEAHIPLSSLSRW